MAGLAAVTGATGFLGRHLALALAADGWQVRVLARRDVIHPLWRDLEPQVVIGGLDDPAALAGLCDGADLVVHAAGLIKAADRAAFDVVNVAGTERLARAAEAAGKSPFLLVSSLAARSPELSDYAASKRAGEEAARRILGERLTIVRPPALYGPGDAETLPLFRAAATSPVLPLLDPLARIALMHVQDAARQIAAIARLAPGGVAALADARPQGYSWRDLMQEAAGAFGAKPVFVRIPGAVLTLAAAFASLAAIRRGGPPALSFGKAREILNRDWAVTPQEQMRELPAPAFDLRSGFLHAVNGYRASGITFDRVKHL